MVEYYVQAENALESDDQILQFWRFATSQKLRRDEIVPAANALFSECFRMFGALVALECAMHLWRT